MQMTQVCGGEQNRSITQVATTVTKSRYHHHHAHTESTEKIRHSKREGKKTIRRTWTTSRQAKNKKKVMRWGAKLQAPPATPERAETPSTGPVRWTLVGFFANQFPCEDRGLNSSTWQVTRVSPAPTHGLCQRIDAGDGSEVAGFNYMHRYVPSDST